MRKLKRMNFAASGMYLSIKALWPELSRCRFSSLLPEQPYLTLLFEGVGHFKEQLRALKNKIK
ncbi:hypothetical protein [Acinetobacter sp.]|uniref:hypothetical protein n=1 Tax=Acinetobacter sp. TaxID=472 RepID=UPI0035B2F1E0